jgi:hypothetical protein
MVQMMRKSRAHAETKKKERTSPPVGQRRRYTVLSFRSSTIHIFFMSIGASGIRAARHGEAMGAAGSADTRARSVAGVYIIEIGELRSVAGGDMNGDTTSMNMYK